MGSEEARGAYTSARRSHWDGIAQRMDVWKSTGGYYYDWLKRIYAFLVPPGQRVMELGCAQGDLLASLRPVIGVGVDLSMEMLRRASRRHPGLCFVQSDAHQIGLRGSFDTIILSDLVNELWDLQSVFQEIGRLATSRTRIIINMYSRVWELPLAIAQRLGMAKPLLPQNWLTMEDVNGLLNLADFEPIRHWREILWPLRTPLVGEIFNRFVGRTWPFHYLALTNFVVARPRRRGKSVNQTPSVSVVVPARNEAGNIPQLMKRVPEMGGGTEIVFVEGHSRDSTYEVIEKEMALNPHRPCKLFRQRGMGKGDAVRLGFARAAGDILMILDADLTVPPEDLPRFYEVLVSGKGEFGNGVRLVYPLAEQAMRFFNLVGNKFFSLAFSWLLGQPIKDTLCGTKALWRSDYERIAENRSFFGDFDPFGDFDLLFGAAKLNLKIVEVPIRYAERVYGTTNIHRWKHGWLLLRMTAFAMRRMKFV